MKITEKQNRNSKTDPPAPNDTFPAATGSYEGSSYVTTVFTFFSCRGC